MQPMQPMVPMQPMQQPPQKPELSGMLKAVLVMKALGALLVLGATFLALAALNAVVKPGAIGSEGRATMHALGQILMLVAGVQLVELVGIAGTWSFKRWGVYTLAAFSMLDLVLNLKTANAFSLTIGLVTSLIVALGIASRWKDFE
jgi:hypothetical protein